MKIQIYGYSGSGKSTLAHDLGAKLGLPVLHMDTVHFLPGWRVREMDEKRRMVETFMKNDDWVIDGNYTNLFYRERMEQADRIIFMNFNRLTCLRRVLRRYLENRGRSRTSMAEGCNEKIDAEFIRWVLWGSRTRRARRRNADIAREYAHKTTILRNQRELDAFRQQMEIAFQNERGV